MRWIQVVHFCLLFAMAVAASVWQNEDASAPYSDNIIPSSYWLVKSVNLPAGVQVVGLQLYGFDRGQNGDLLETSAWADDQGKPGTLLAQNKKSVSVTGSGHFENVPLTFQTPGSMVWIGLKMRNAVGFLWFDPKDSATDFFFDGQILTRLGRTYSVRIMYENKTESLVTNPAATPTVLSTQTPSPVPLPGTMNPLVPMTWQNENASFQYTDNIIPASFWLVKKTDFKQNVRLTAIDLVGMDRGTNGDRVIWTLWNDLNGLPGNLVAEGNAVLNVTGSVHLQTLHLPAKMPPVFGSLWVGLKMTQNVGFLSFDQADRGTDFYYSGNQLQRLGRTYSLRVHYVADFSNPTPIPSPNPSLSPTPMPSPVPDSTPETNVSLNYFASTQSDALTLQAQVVEWYAQLVSSNPSRTSRSSTYRTGPNGYTVADRICDLGGLALTWKTAPVPSSFNEGNVTFAFYAGVGTRFGWNAPFQLNLNGKTVLSGLPVMNGQLVFTDESSVLLQQKASTDGGLWTEGVFWVTVPAIWITPGQPATFSLQYPGPLMTGGCYYNFYLFEFPDVASFEYAYQSNTAQGGTFPLTRIGTNLGIPFDFFPPQGLGLSSQTTSRLVNLNTVSSGFSSPAMTRVWDQLWRQNPKYSREEIWSALDAWLSRQAARPPSVSTVVQANATPVPIATPSPSATPAPTTLRPLNTEAKQQITDMLDGYNLFYQTFQKTAQESGRMIDTFRMNTDVSLAETTLCKQYFQKGDPYWSIGNGELFVPFYLVTLCQTPDKNFQTSRKLVTTCLSGNGVTVDLELFNWIKSLGTKVNTQAVPVCDVSDSQVTVRLFLPGGFIGVGEYRYSLSPSGQRSDNAQSEAALNAVFLGFSAFPALRSLSPQRQLVYKGTHVVENGRLVTVNVHATNPPVPEGASPFATTIADFSLSVFQDWMESLIAHAEKT